MEKTLNRLLFLAESNDILGALTVRFVLKESYPASAIGHLRAFVFLSLREIKHDIFCIWFGTSDRADRFRDDGRRDMQPGIGRGRSSGQWEQHVKIPKDEAARDEAARDKEEATGEESDEAEERYTPVGWSSGIGMDPVPVVIARYNHDETLIRFHPRLALRDLDDSSFLPFLNASLAEKLHSFQVFANGYKLADFGPGDFKIDRSDCGDGFPGDFTEEELSDAWVRIRPSNMSSTFYLRFAATTPRRMFGHDEPIDNPGPNPSSS